MLKHANIAFFVPHAGCPFRCSFCDQVSISGQTSALSPKEVKTRLDEILSGGKIDCEKTEIAFFGGSFTAIDRSLMVEYLKSANEVLKRENLAGIRISTRPDYIDDEVLKILKYYGVTSVELGAQSMDDRVLLSNMRGHTSKHTETSSYLIKKHGFWLGLQMMAGLYKQTARSTVETAIKLCELKPQTVRIYPTLVLEGSYLEDRYRALEYTPLSLNSAVIITKELIKIFDRNNIDVIRVGLHDQAGLKDRVVAGPYHPAFGELCQSALFFDRIKCAIDKNPKGSYNVYVNGADLSKAIGHKQKNRIAFAKLGYNLEFIKDDNLKPNQIYIKRRI